MSNKGHFHITITENKTGRVLYNIDSDCLIGAYHEGELDGGTAVRALNASYCNLRTMIETLAGVKQVTEILIERDTNLQRYRPLIDKCLSHSTTVQIDASPLLAKDD